MYHEGFSLGDNFCEAFNFGTKEWFQFVGKWVSKILYYVLKLQIDLRIKSRSTVMDKSCFTSLLVNLLTNL